MKKGRGFKWTAGLEQLEKSSNVPVKKSLSVEEGRNRYLRLCSLRAELGRDRYNRGAQVVTLPKLKFMEDGNIL